MNKLIGLLLMCLVGCATPKHVEIPEPLPQVIHSPKEVLQKHYFSPEDRDHRLEEVREQHKKLSEYIDRLGYNGEQLGRRINFILASLITKMENSETVEEFIKYREMFNETVSVLDDAYNSFTKMIDRSIDIYLKINDNRSTTVTVPIP